jgi:hypothetical protein
MPEGIFDAIALPLEHVHQITTLLHQTPVTGMLSPRQPIEGMFTLLEHGLASETVQRLNRLPSSNPTFLAMCEAAYNVFQHRLHDLAAYTKRAALCRKIVTAVTHSLGSAQRAFKAACKELEERDRRIHTAHAFHLNVARCELDERLEALEHSSQPGEPRQAVELLRLQHALLLRRVFHDAGTISPVDRMVAASKALRKLGQLDVLEQGFVQTFNVFSFLPEYEEDRLRTAGLYQHGRKREVERLVDQAHYDLVAERKALKVEAVACSRDLLKVLQQHNKQMMRINPGS